MRNVQLCFYNNNPKVKNTPKIIDVRTLTNLYTLLSDIISLLSKCTSCLTFILRYSQISTTVSNRSGSSDTTVNHIHVVIPHSRRGIVVLDEIKEILFYFLFIADIYLLADPFSTRLVAVCSAYVYSTCAKCKGTLCLSVSLSSYLSLSLLLY